MTWAEINIPNPPANIDPDLYGWLTQLVAHLRAYLGAYHDRGSHASSDFNAAALTKDSAWHDLDLSGIVDEDAKAVHLNVVIRNSTVDAQVVFRKNGYTSIPDEHGIRTQVADQRLINNIIVPCDENRIIEYNVANVGTWATINLNIQGWFK